jgi:hypothetical protein
MVKMLLFSGCFLLCTSYTASYRYSDPTLLLGTVSVGNETSMDACEVTLNEWLFFLDENRGDSSLFPDERALPSPWYSLLLADVRNGRPFHYLRGGGNGFFGLKWRSIDSLPRGASVPINAPITGITYEQALRYCKWLENKVNKDRSADRQIVIGLPSVALYKQVIENVDSVSHHAKVPCHRFTFNYKHPVCDDRASPPDSQGESLVRADAYWPSKWGLYCLQGNAAEMTSLKGIAMGGSYRHYAWQSHSDQWQTYSKPEEWLGFRFIVTRKIVD